MSPSFHPLLSRRAFLGLGLKIGLLAGCACFIPAEALASTAGGLGVGRFSGKTPTAAQAERMRADFAGVCQGAQAMLAPRVGGAKAEHIGREAQVRFAALIPAIPDIGAGNRNAESLLEAVWLTALTQAMTGAGLSHRDAGRLFYEMCVLEKSKPITPEQRASVKAMFGPVGRSGLAAWARRTQARRYPGDWVAEVVPGDGASFDLGYNYSQCGAVLFFKAHGVEKVAPYFCLNDFTVSRAQGSGLRRAHTIAQGDALCDFRFKLDGPVPQSWETEEPRFRKS